MIPTSALTWRTIVLLAGDVNTLADPGGCKVHLVAEPFTPGPSIALADLALATFAGSAPLLGTIGPQEYGVDPVTTDRFVLLLEPAGGWTWSCSTIPPAPETIHGYVVTDADGSTTFGSALLEQPVTVAGVADTIAIAWIRLTANGPLWH